MELAGVEPTTDRLSSDCSTIELQFQIYLIVMTDESHIKLVGIEPTTSRLEGDNPRSTSPRGKRRMQSR
jgi:hypothetical protein